MAGQSLTWLLERVVVVGTYTDRVCTFYLLTFTYTWLPERVVVVHILCVLTYLLTYLHVRTYLLIMAAVSVPRLAGFSLIT